MSLHWDNSGFKLETHGRAERPLAHVLTLRNWYHYSLSLSHWFNQHSVVSDWISVGLTPQRGSACKWIWCSSSCYAQTDEMTDSLIWFVKDLYFIHWFIFRNIPSLFTHPVSLPSLVSQQPPVSTWHSFCTNFAQGFGGGFSWGSWKRRCQKQLETVHLFSLLDTALFIAHTGIKIFNLNRNIQMWSL